MVATRTIPPVAPRLSLKPANRESRTPALMSAHLVGSCGAGMKALAELLLGRGCRLTGSDLQGDSPTARSLARRGLRVQPGHCGDNVPVDADVLVFSPAVAATNPERLRAAELGIPQYSYSEMLGRLMREKTGVSIAGTHGKSTTTAMTAWVLHTAGLSPSAVVGAELCELNVNGWAGDGPLFVAESCEYQHSFWDLSPQHAAILALEPDHFDCFATFDDTVAAFARFAESIPSGGLLLIGGDCPASRRACAGAGGDVQTFSLERQADWSAGDLRPSPAGTRFHIFRRGEFFTEAATSLPGVHNVLNALAAAALCERVGADPAAIREGLSSFPGIRRRFEVVGTWRGVTFVDDYAHHPTAVRATLAAARARFAGRRIVCVFQPHQVSRTLALMGEFAASFGDADEVYVSPVFAAREQVTDEPRAASFELAGRIALSGQRAQYAPSLDQMLTTLEDGLRPGDVLITMGAGDIGEVHHAFTRRFSRNHAAR